MHGNVVKVHNCLSALGSSTLITQRVIDNGNAIWTMQLSRCGQVLCGAQLPGVGRHADKGCVDSSRGVLIGSALQRLSIKFIFFFWSDCPATHQAPTSRRSLPTILSVNRHFHFGLSHQLFDSPPSTTYYRKRTPSSIASLFATQSASSIAAFIQHFL